jgi:hypothetical protein
MTDALVERLMRRPLYDGPVDSFVNPDGPEAAFRIISLTEENERLRAQIEVAAVIFDEYERLHLAKGTPDGDAKAKRNAQYAAEMRAANKEG